MLKQFSTLHFFLVLFLSSCQDEGGDPCQTDPFSVERQTVAEINDVYVVIRKQSQYVSYFEVKDHPAFANLYFDPLVLKTFSIDAFDFESNLVEGVHLRISGYVKKLCPDDPLFEISANPIVISAAEKVVLCDINYAVDETRSYPVKQTHWKFVGFTNNDQSMVAPTCEENQIFLRLAEILIDDPGGFTHEGEMSSHGCSIKYKTLSENHFLISFYICTAMVPSTTHDAAVFLNRFATALLDPTGVETEVDHNILYVYSPVETLPLIFVAVD